MGESTSLGHLNGTGGAPTLCRACRGPHGLFPLETGLPLRRVFARDSWLSVLLPGLSVPQLRPGQAEQAQGLVPMQVALVTPCCPWASGRGVSSCFPLVHSVPRCLWGACPVSGPCLSGSCGPVADQLYWVPPGRDCRLGSPPGLAALRGGDQAQRCPDSHLWTAACSVACALSGRFMSACWGQCLVAADPCPPQGSCVPGAAGERGASGGRAGLGRWAGRGGRQSHGLLGSFLVPFLVSF